MDLPQQQQHPEINLDENRGARVMLMEKTLLNPIFLVALMMYSLLIGNSLSGRTATPHGYGAPPPSPAGLATFMGVSFMCLSFVTVGMVHLVLVLHLTMAIEAGWLDCLRVVGRLYVRALPPRGGARGSVVGQASRGDVRCGGPTMYRPVLVVLQ
ncbi:Os07g0594400 [Oryza sativa Japonica Group]|uniref:Os07g0594400 protein n=1 Tax=Oryza sativa subsp. japonica TaxID=39947 RepID=C7J5D2_ORYSJ|nr:Os07g0594400 [Oryza sativa Japonica Group]|eukprot:NP_001175283.1 Os07g0594400 [Oryza sativa Japonica Group]